jgi:hypothetical protein
VTVAPHQRFKKVARYFLTSSKYFKKVASYFKKVASWILTFLFWARLVLKVPELGRIAVAPMCTQWKIFPSRLHL